MTGNMSGEQKEISVRAWAQALARSFLIQSVWNNERMQNIGFAYSISPLINSGGEEENRRKIEAHLEFFNTNPYFASAVIGAVGRMEGDRRGAEDVRSFKRSLMGPFGALGDSLFWCSMKPAAALVGVSIAIGGRMLWAIVATLVIYNSLHLWARLWGFYNGASLGRWMLYRFTRIRFARSAALLGLTTAVLLAWVTVWGGIWGDPLSAVIGGHYLVAGAIGSGIVLLSSMAIGRGMGAETLFYLAGGIALAASLTIG